MRKTYGPTKCNEVDHLIDEEILCAQNEEGLGYYGILEWIDPNSDSPYICRLAHNDCVSNFKWIAAA